MAQEKLLLRKGLHADLVNAAKCPITPGAISITTDEPGIYIDLAADANHINNYRVRIGDVIVVPKLDDLLRSTATDAQKFSSNALYYANDKNVLCKYDEDQGKFVWINDTSSLQSSINTINGNITTINNNITNIQADIGTRTANNAATKDKTIFKAIEDEYARATQAESDLANEIATIKGNGSSSTESLKKLRDDLTKEESDRKSADQTLQNNINALAGDGRTSETVKGNADAIGVIQSKLGTIESNAEKNIIEIVKKNGTPLDVDSTDRSVNITMSLSELKDGASVQQQIDNNTSNITTNANAIDVLEGQMSAAEKDITSLEATVGSSSDDRTKTTIFGRISAEVYTREQAVSTLQGKIKALSDTVNSNQTTLENKITAEAQARADADTQIRKDFAAADDALEAELKKYVNDNLATADAMTFKGTVSYKTGSTTELNLPNGTEVDAEGNKILVQAGDTYVVSANLHDSNHVYHAGDMLIAKADQKANDATYTGGWEHVKTGYDVVHESKLSVAQNANKINLTSHVGSNLGSVEFTSSSSNIAISKTAGNTGTINFDLVWATF